MCVYLVKEKAFECRWGINMKESHHSHVRFRNIVKFIVTPLLFCAIAASLIIVVANPIIKPYTDLFQVTFLQKPPTFSGGISNIYQNNGQSELTKSSMKSPNDMPIQGQQIGTLTIQSAKIDTPVIYGDDTQNLKKGACIYVGSGLPGQRRTILISGHVDTVFSSLKSVKTGDLIKIKTTYGDYEYQVTGQKSAKDTDSKAINLLKKEENLVLYTCDRSSNVVGLTSQRYYVYAKYVSGKQISSAG